jgi:hypothetical protein
MNQAAETTDSEPLNDNDVHVYVRLPRHIAGELEELQERMVRIPEVRRFMSSKQMDVSRCVAIKFAIGRALDQLRAEERAAG